MGEIVAFIPRDLAGHEIRQRATDGYIDATAMCRATRPKKLFANWRQNAETDAFIDELSAHIGIPICELIQSLKGGPWKGTWVHPKVAIALAEWLSPEFHVQVVSWVHEGLVGKAPPPQFVSTDQLVTAIKEAIAPRFGGLDNRLERVESKIEQNHQQACQRFTDIEKRLPKGPHRPPTASAIRQNILGLQVTGCRCPMCRETILLDSNGRRFPESSEWDHTGGRDNRTFWGGWYICIKCHDDVTNGVITPAEANHAAESFRNSVARKLGLTKPKRKCESIIQLDAFREASAA